MTNTIAGSGVRGSEDNQGLVATLDSPVAVAISSDSSTVYILDELKATVRSYNVETQALRTIAGREGLGDVDGHGDVARFRGPRGLAILPARAGPDASGRNMLDRTYDVLIITDTLNQKIKAMSTHTRQVITVAGSGAWNNEDGPAGSASFYLPQSSAVAPNGKFILVADAGNNAIRKVDLMRGGRVTTVAGSFDENKPQGLVDAVGRRARFTTPSAIAIDHEGLFAYVSDTDNNVIRRVDLATAAVTTIAGTGQRGALFARQQRFAAAFNYPRDIKMSTDNKKLYVADSGNHVISEVNLMDCKQVPRNESQQRCMATILAGWVGHPGSRDDIGRASTFSMPTGLAVGTYRGQEVIVVADSGNHRVRVLRRISGYHGQEEPHPPTALEGATFPDPKGNRFPYKLPGSQRR